MENEMEEIDILKQEEEVQLEQLNLNLNICDRF